MDGHYWSVERCGWEPCPSVPDALVTPWSAHGLAVPALPHPADAAQVLRMPSRAAVIATAVTDAAVPDQRGAAALGEPVRQ